MKAAGFFISGTDTDVGKTMLTAALGSALLAQGHRLAIQKPVQTGGRMVEKSWVAPDLDFLLETLGMKPDPETMAAMLPYCYAPACSPHLAARQAGDRIALDAVLYAFNQLAAAHDRILVEGAGGVLVPINDRENMRDIMRILGLPVILAIRPSLGTLNHTLLSIEALRAMDISVAGFVSVNTTPAPWGTIEQDNMETLEQQTRIGYLGDIPFFNPVAPGPELSKRLLPVGTNILRKLARHGFGF